MTTTVPRIRIGRHQTRLAILLSALSAFCASLCSATSILRRLVYAPRLLSWARALHASPDAFSRIGNKGAAPHGFCTGSATVGSAARGSVRRTLPPFTTPSLRDFTSPDSFTPRTHHASSLKQPVYDRASCRLYVYTSTHRASLTRVGTMPLPSSRDRSGRRMLGVTGSPRGPAWRVSVTRSRSVQDSDPASHSAGRAGFINCMQAPTASVKLEASLGAGPVPRGILTTSANVGRIHQRSRAHCPGTYPASKRPPKRPLLRQTCYGHDNRGSFLARSGAAASGCVAFIAYRS
ncbi:hypothetical protein FKP32DRAFT_839871 [Trametes sanguinea]|nr:hypothetical protein FKP32DRAFT_839871 [Trametes sanguinea]